MSARRILIYHAIVPVLIGVASLVLLVWVRAQHLGCDMDTINQRTWSAEKADAIEYCLGNYANSWLDEYANAMLPVVAILCSMYGLTAVIFVLLPSRRDDKVRSR